MSDLCWRAEQSLDDGPAGGFLQAVFGSRDRAERAAHEWFFLRPDREVTILALADGRETGRLRVTRAGDLTEGDWPGEAK